MTKPFKTKKSSPIFLKKKRPLSLRGEEGTTLFFSPKSPGIGGGKEGDLLKGRETQ